MDREKTIQQIVAAMSALEKCSEQDIENTKKFLRWMSDDVLKGIWERHEKALEERTLLLTRRQQEIT